MNVQSLTGLVVVDASRVLAGPYCGQILGDHGATVIKIESPEGDETRYFGPQVKDGSAAYYQALNRNKRSIVLDMNTSDGMEAFWRLIQRADVLIENFKPSTLRTWGVENAGDLVEKYPRLIHCRITGFGDTGPLGGMPGYDAAVQAASGLMSINGEEGREGIRLGIPAVDLTTGMQATIAVLLALQERATSGRGQLCDVSLYDCAISIAHPHVANYLWGGAVPTRTGNAHPNISPYETYESATCPIFIAAGNDRQFATLCRELGNPGLALDGRFAKNPDRIVHRLALRDAIHGSLKTRDGTEFAAQLQACGVPAAPVLEIPEVLQAPQTEHRHMVIERDGYRGTGFPIKLSRTPAKLQITPPLHGQHTDEILAEIGFS